MLPRYSKNFCIIPQLDPGPIHLQILFQQNEFPPQNFTVIVPENGFRGFLLTKKENDFALYDIQQRFYLFPGDRGEDHLSEMVAIPDYKKNKPAEGTKKTNPDEPLFIDDLILNNEQTVQDQNIIEKPAPDTTPVVTIADENFPKEVIPETDAAVVIEDDIELPTDEGTEVNPECSQAIQAAELNNIYTTVKNKTEEEERLDYLLAQVDDRCYTTKQVHMLCKQLESEGKRYAFLKKVYPHVTDQQNFQVLEDHLFQTFEWKSYFRLIQFSK